MRWRVVFPHERDEHRLSFLLVNLDEAVALELFFKRGGKLDQLLFQGEVLDVGKLLEWDRRENRDVRFAFHFARRLAVGGAAAGAGRVIKTCRETCARAEPVFRPKKLT